MSVADRLREPRKPLNSAELSAIELAESIRSYMKGRYGPLYTTAYLATLIPNGAQLSTVIDHLDPDGRLADSQPCIVIDASSEDIRSGLDGSPGGLQPGIVIDLEAEDNHLDSDRLAAQKVPGEFWRTFMQERLFVRDTDHNKMQLIDTLKWYVMWKKEGVSSTSPPRIRMDKLGCRHPFTRKWGNRYGRGSKYIQCGAECG